MQYYKAIGSASQRLLSRLKGNGSTVLALLIHDSENKYFCQSANYNNSSAENLNPRITHITIIGPKKPLQYLLGMHTGGGLILFGCLQYWASTFQKFSYTVVGEQQNET